MAPVKIDLDTLLGWQEVKVVRMRFGLEGRKAMSHKEIAAAWRVNERWVYQKIYDARVKVLEEVARLQSEGTEVEVPDFVKGYKLIPD